MGNRNNKKVLTDKEDVVEKLELLYKERYNNLSKGELVAMLIARLDIDGLSDATLANRLSIMSNDEFSFEYKPKT